MNPENQNNQDNDCADDGPNWKWWHFLLAGVLVAAVSVWRWWDTGRLKYLNGLFLAALCVLVGVGMRPKKGA